MVYDYVLSWCMLYRIYTNGRLPYFYIYIKKKIHDFWENVFGQVSSCQCKEGGIDGWDGTGVSEWIVLAPDWGQ